ncbi:hypothetical protein AgCh_028929 [Apium graveolens]
MHVGFETHLMSKFSLIHRVTSGGFVVWCLRLFARCVMPRNAQGVSNLTVHVISDTIAIALYSASKMDLETVDSFLDFQLIGEPPNNYTYPVTDLLESGQVAQSESENACNVN